MITVQYDEACSREGAARRKAAVQYSTVGTINFPCAVWSVLFECFFKSIHDGENGNSWSLFQHSAAGWLEVQYSTVNGLSQPRYGDIRALFWSCIWCDVRCDDYQAHLGRRC